MPDGMFDRHARRNVRSACPTECPIGMPDGVFDRPRCMGAMGCNIGCTGSMLASTTVIFVRNWAAMGLVRDQEPHFSALQGAEDDELDMLDLALDVREERCGLLCCNRVATHADTLRCDRMAEPWQRNVGLK